MPIAFVAWIIYTIGSVIAFHTQIQVAKATWVGDFILVDFSCFVAVVAVLTLYKFGLGIFGVTHAIIS